MRIVVTLRSMLTIVGLCALQLYAAERTETDMRDIARKALSEGSTTRGSADLTKVAQSATYAIYDGYGGFVVVGRDESSPAVLGRSLTPYDEASMPPGLRWWLEATDRALSNRPSTRGFTAGQSYTPTECFIKTKWGQYAPFNAYCTTTSGQQCVTGCVSTAISQILYYYKYPSTYDWSAMSDNYNGTESNSVVAQLLYDCGVATNTLYLINDNGEPQGNAFDYDAATALTSSFGFSSANIQYLTRHYYSDRDWMRIIYSELQARRPIMYGGEGTGGHAFLLCGIDQSGNVYINWGWYGTCDGWYDISHLNPENSTYDFNYNQSMIVGIAPTTMNVTLRPRYSELCYMYSPNEGYDGSALSFVPNGKNALKIADGSSIDIVNFHYLSFQGKVDLVLDNGSQTYALPFLNVKSASGTWRLSGYSYSPVIDLTSLPPDQYIAYLATRSSSDDDFRPVRAYGGPASFVVFKATDGTISVTSPQVYSETNLFNSVVDEVPVVDGISLPLADNQNAQPNQQRGSRSGSFDLRGISSSATHHGIVVVNGRKYAGRAK